MAVGTGHTVADLIMAAKWRIGGASITGFPTAPFYVQLHSADPGASGTTAVLLSGRRIALGSMVSSGTGTGQVSNAADVVFTNVAAAFTGNADISIWGGTGAATGPSGGTLIITGVAGGSASINDDYTFSAGSIVDTYIETA